MTTRDQGQGARPEQMIRARYNREVIKHVIRVSEAEAATDFRSLMAHVRAGAEIIIQQGTTPVAVLHAAEPARRTVSECIALAKAHEEETGTAPVLDADFADEVADILNKRKPWTPPVWQE